MFSPHMRILLVYYTGTYNTRFLTEKVKERLEKNGHFVSALEVNCGTEIPVLTDVDLLGLGYPIYGFNVPHPFLKLIKKLNIPRGLSYFVYKDSGETYGMNTVSSRRIHRFMRERGSNLMGEYHFVMPYNIHFEFPLVFIKEAIRENKKYLEVMVHNLENGIVRKEKGNLLYTIGAFFVGIQAIGGPVNSFFYRVNKDKCTQCGLCIARCPEKNISLKKGKIHFGHKCDMCMRCSFDCPTKAIHIGFLERWRVHRYYHLEKLWNEDEGEPYIREDTKGFYSCFISYFHKVDEAYFEIMKKNENQ